MPLLGLRQVSLGVLKACESKLLEMREMEEMVEFMKNEVPNWDPGLLQVQRLAQALDRSKVL